MEIYKLNLHSLRNDEHVNFMEFTVTATEKYPYITETFEKPVECLTLAYEAEDEAYLKSTRHPLTKEIQAANDERILRFRSVNALLYSASIGTDKPRAEAAAFLMDIVRDYGGESAIVKKRVNALSGVLTNLCQDLQERFAEKTEAVGATACVEELRVANETYKQLRSQRTEETSETIKAALRDARNVSDREWRYFIDSVNLRYYYDQDVQLVPFMRYMNAEIDTYRIQLGQGVGGNSSTNKPGAGSDDGTAGGGGGGTTTPSIKDAKFIFINGTSQSFPVEVGAQIIAPLNTVGYKWKPVPGVMPKTNRTFREVPIVDVQTIALFHFADHTEEEIRQFVGTLLHAPANTAGYYWDPTVPATMPAEDTQYYELPVENNEGGGEGSGGNGGGENTNPGTGGENTNPGTGGENTNPGTGGGNTDKVTVTFNFENGTTETREYPKGTILRPGGTNYPANTPGYNWSILNVTLNSDTNAWEVSEGDSGLD